MITPIDRYQLREMLEKIQFEYWSNAAEHEDDNLNLNANQRARDFAIYLCEELHINYLPV
jgi:hypothetical protein